MENLADIPRDLSGGPRELRTDKGTTIQADLVFVCIGVTINKTAYSESLGSGKFKFKFKFKFSLLIFFISKHKGLHSIGNNVK